MKTDIMTANTVKGRIWAHVSHLSSLVYQVDEAVQPGTEYGRSPLTLWVLSGHCERRLRNRVMP